MPLTEFQQFVGVPYNYKNGPDLLNGDETITEELNCQALVHRIYNKFGVRLPSILLSKEIFEERELFLDVLQSDLKISYLKMLDVFVFGKQNERDLRKLHLGVFTGEVDEGLNPIIIHATSVEQQVVIWPLEKFFLYPQYQKLYAIKRLKM